MISNKPSDMWLNYNARAIRTDNMDERRAFVSVISFSTFLFTFATTSKKYFRFGMRNGLTVYFVGSYLLYKSNLNPF